MPNFYQTPFWLDLRGQAIRRAGGKCEVPGCGSRKRLTVDHIEPRPRGAYRPTPQDVLTNLRVLCVTHDNQVKQDASGARRSGGAFKVPGCDASGAPIDPQHAWNR